VQVLCTDTGMAVKVCPVIYFVQMSRPGVEFWKRRLFKHKRKVVVVHVVTVGLYIVMILCDFKHKIYRTESY